MIRNYFKTAWRNLLRNRTFAFVNIIGLAIGFSCFILLSLYVYYELSYDKHHQHADRIYRVHTDMIFGGIEQKFAVTSDPMGATLKKDYPEIEQYTRIYASSGSKQVKKGNEFNVENRVAYADSTFFEVFTFNAIEGNTANALDDPNSVVISKLAALKYFGRTSVVDETLEIADNEQSLFKITAVIDDMPDNGHFKYDFIFSMDNLQYDFGSYLSHNFHTYLLLKPGTDPAIVEGHFMQVMQTYILPQASSFLNINSMEEFKKAGNKLEYNLMPLRDIHLKSNRVAELSVPGNLQYVYIFSAVAIFILLLACFNFINLSTANSGSRAREIGVRKVLGSERGALLRQFLSESVMASLLATVIALVLVSLFMNAFNNLASKNFSLFTLFSPLPVLVIFLFAVVVGMLAGIYPAMFLSGFKPLAALRSQKQFTSGKSVLRNVLVVFQFSIAIILIVGCTVMYKQIRFIQNQQLGYKKEQLLVINETQVLGSNGAAFMEEVKSLPGVHMGTQAGYLPVSNSSRSDNPFSTESVMSASNTFTMQQWDVDEDYIPTMGMVLTEGRNFSRDFGGDSSGIIINETCAQMMGGDNVVGKKLYTSFDNTDGSVKGYTVIGVVKNFHYESMRQQIAPLCMQLGNAGWCMAFKVSTANLEPLIANVEQKFKQMAVGKPFSYQFLDESFDDMYKNEQRVASLALVFAILAVLIACLGLYGLATYMAHRRIKEIGIRKVLGATVASVVGLLSIDFIKLVAFAAIIAFPVAYYIMNRWLMDFAFRTTLDWWVFVLAAVLGILIALFSVSFEAIKAALANPVKSIRTE